MTDNLSVEDVAEMRRDGSLREYLAFLAGRTPTRAKAEPPRLTAVPTPGYRIAHTGGWPLGTAATGPTPPPDRCTCAKCGGNPASRTSTGKARRPDAGFPSALPGVQAPVAASVGVGLRPGV